MSRPKIYTISLTDDELKTLKSVMRKKQTPKTVRNRCQIIIDLDEAHGKTLTHKHAAKTNCVCMATITNTGLLYTSIPAIFSKRIPKGTKVIRAMSLVMSMLDTKHRKTRVKASPFFVFTLDKIRFPA